MKIAILSCFYPYRGGIAQFNAYLHGELSKQNIVRAFNFKRQYPNFLFPGKTQFVTPEDEAVPVESTPLLDTANPFNWRSTAREIRDWDPDVLIVRYWMSYLAPSLGYVCRNMKPQCKVIVIADNIIPHERHFFDKPMARYMLSGADACITLCDKVGEDLQKVNKKLPHKTLPHPVYSHFGEILPRKKAEKILGLQSGKRNILFFGLIREYKGLDILLQAFDRLNNNYQLIIAGEPYGSFSKYQRMIDESPNGKNVHCFLNYIKDSEVKNYFSAADVTVLPYRSATQSGISTVSNHFEVPMIVTDVGGLKETIGDKGTGIVCKDSTPETIANNIMRFFKNESLRNSFLENIKRENEKSSWSRFCSDLLEFSKCISK